jgi:thymidylate synthase (FAD)
MILPQAMVTEQYKTGSLLGWYHLVSLRKDPHAQKETQILAEQVENIIQDLFPVSWGALVNG